MKKAIAPLLAVTLGLANISPVLANANEVESAISLTDTSSNQDVSNAVDADFDYEIFTDKKTNIDTVHVIYDGVESVTTVDYNTGEVKTDGVLTATLKDPAGLLNAKNIILSPDFSSDDRSDFISSDLSPLANYPSYVIGSESYGSGAYDFKWVLDGSFDVISLTATVSSVTATVISIIKTLSGKEVSKTTQIVAAATVLFTQLNTSKTTYFWKTYHYKDKNRSAWYNDMISFYKARSADPDHLKLKISHYYGNTF